MHAKFRSMRARMTALFALFVTLLMALGASVVQRREVRRAETRSREILAVAIERASDELDNDDHSGRTLLESVRSDDNEIAAGGLGLMVVQGDRVLWRSRRQTPTWPNVGASWRIAQVSQGGQTLVVARDWAAVTEDLREATRALWILSALVVGATTLGAWFLVGVTLAPLDALAAQAENASIEGLAVRLNAPSSDAEMLHLTRTLNNLLGRLEREAQARGRFYAAASHELRTPIQALQGEIEVTLSRPRSVEFYQESLAELQGETGRLKSLTQDLLQLNALEMRQVQTACESLDLKQWTERALLQQCASIEEHNLHLEARLEETEIEAPPVHLEMLLRNLLENAVKYACPASALQVEICADSGGAHLRIWNACEVPDDSELWNWFEPFYRPDESRDSQTGGNGLGLSIVAALARANGWKVELNRHAGGVEARVGFPKGVEN